VVSGRHHLSFLVADFFSIDNNLRIKIVNGAIWRQETQKNDGDSVLFWQCKANHVDVDVQCELDDEE